MSFAVDAGTRGVSGSSAHSSSPVMPSRMLMPTPVLRAGSADAAVRADSIPARVGTGAPDPSSASTGSTDGGR